MLYLTLFGHFQATWDDEPLTFPTESTRALVAYLALEQHKPHPRSHIATLLWPDNTEEQGRHNLRQTLLRLRQTVPDTADGHPLLLATKDTLQWNPAYPVQVDAHQFENHMAEAKPFLRGPLTETPYPAFAPLQAGLALYHANLLLGLELHNDLYAEWLQGWRIHYQRQALNGLARLAESHGRAGQPAHMERLARRQTAIAPEREEGHIQLMQAYLTQGEYTAALQQYTLCQKILHDEGQTPSPALQQLHQQANAWRMGQPPPLAPIPHNLPPEETPFYGRQAELDDLLLWLAAPSQRLLTLKGLGGMGKTRLALEAARHLTQPWPALPPRFPGGVWFVSLAEVQTDEPDALAQAILQVCGWGTQRGETAVQAAIRHLRASTQLLLLDNLEHLPCSAQFCLDLLTADPSLTILATSRHRLGLQRETVRLVQGLPLPQHEGDTAAPSVALLSERIGRVDGRFRPTPAIIPHLTRICRALDGWPLALELAAGWAEVMYVAEIAERVTGNLAALHTSLPDVPARQRSVQTVLAGSYALLTPVEQRILTRFALFQGGCTAEAAATVLGATPEEMALLVRRSLLQQDAHGRYTIHELIRQFAAELLEKSADHETAAHAHATYYLSLPVALEGALHGADPLTAVNQLRPERENIRQAWHWAVRAGVYAPLSAALLSLTRFYNITGLLREGEALLQETRAAVTEPPFAHDLLLAHTNLHLRLGQYPEVQQLLASLPPLDTLPPIHQLYAHHLWGEWAMLQDYIPEARQHSTQALALARTLNNQAVIITSLARLDLLHDYDTPYQAEVLALVGGITDRWLKRFVHNFLGAAAIRHGRYTDAHTHWQEALAISLEFEDGYTAASLYNNLGDVLRQLGQHSAAEHAFQQAIALYHQLHSPILHMYPLEGWARLCIHRHQYAEALPLAQQSLALAQALHSELTQVTALSSLGHAYVGLQMWSQAQEAYGRAAVLLPAFPRWAMESVAGLAYVAWQMGDNSAARTHINQFLALLATCPLEGSSSPSLTYGRCYEVLLGLGDGARAAEIQAVGQAWLAEQTANLPTAEDRALFLANVPAQALLMGEADTMIAQLLANPRHIPHFSPLTREGIYER